MTAEEAVLHLDAQENQFLVFRNAEDERISVIYKRKDGNYGIMRETGEGETEFLNALGYDVFALNFGFSGKNFDFKISGKLFNKFGYRNFRLDVVLI